MGPSVLLAMSGGIDSSAAAVLLGKSGYEVHGLTFRIKGVTSLSVENAAVICRKLGISHRYIDITDRFNDDVIEYFLSEYSAGRTPNPCIMCNRRIKFGLLMDIVKEEGFDFLATGHYATIKEENGRFHLEKSVDPSRDQTYFLYILKEEQLGKILFPLNGIPKEKARMICQDAGLMPADSKESREICFIEDDYRDYLENIKKIDRLNGNFITSSGEIIGPHEGIHRYTIGQRKGLGVSLGKPAFITNINGKTGDITLGDEEELMRYEINVKNVSLINGTVSNTGNIYVKIRYGSRDFEVSGIEFPEKDMMKIILKNPARAVTPGQAAVLYDGNRVLGGGTII